MRKMEKRKKANHRDSDDETAEGSSTTTDCDQDSDVCFMKDSDDEIDTAEIEEEEWIETHRRMKWRLAMRIASLPDERWTKKAATWNPGLSTKYQTNRPVVRPKKRWENEINEFLKPETETTKGNEMKNNDTWIKVAKHRERWKAMESEHAETAAAISVDSATHSENPPQDPVRPARYLNGVKLGDCEVANII